MNITKWKIESLAKGIAPKKAEKELEKIQKSFGKLTPEILLESSRSEKALFHILFEWEDSKAAEKYRLQQARTIINNIEITIISNGEAISIPKYEIINIKNEDRQYKAINALTKSEIEYVKENALIHLKQVSHKLKLYKELEKATFHVEKAVELLLN